MHGCNSMQYIRMYSETCHSGHLGNLDTCINWTLAGGPKFSYTYERHIGVSLENQDISQALLLGHYWWSPRCPLYTSPTVHMCTVCLQTMFYGQLFCATCAILGVALNAIV